MPTRNIYAKLSGVVQDRLPLLQRIQFWAFVGVFPVVILSAMTWGPEKGFGVAARVMWSVICIVSTLIWCGYNINPDRDPIDKVPRESFDVLMINVSLILAVLPWFWGN